MALCDEYKKPKLDIHNRQKWNRGWAKNNLIYNYNINNEIVAREEYKDEPITFSGSKISCNEIEYGISSPIQVTYNTYFSSTT